MLARNEDPPREDRTARGGRQESLQNTADLDSNIDI